MRIKYILLICLNVIVLTAGGCRVYTNYYTDYTLITEEAQIQYLYTEELNLEDVYLLGGDETIVNVTKDMIVSYDKTKIGFQEVVISYNNVMFTYEVEVQYDFN